ncbi:Aste57867_18689 [Aphanomyces stellatus]|uniref:Geranylgeranyl transferase type-2 subunit alpha n=1 Tax=Aphanomyces stellatus TaxID=120398 RepID=A0A485LCG0_9STRA|nr:hypothetical protein As57867_018627 [Aphanomyces stellatus]VFT95424.1 Aste57867_18689 [Aphanomyces stellatus]
MHGIRKSDVPKTPEEEAAIATHVKQYKEVSSQVMAMKKDRQFDDHALKLSALVVVLNPEFWIIWAFRRDAILHLLRADESRKKELGDAEVKLTMEALMKNPKSYSAWFQRQWIVDQGMADLEKEIRLCDALLNKDERNFHCWNYRRYLSKLAKHAPEQNLAFAAQKITQNFSNYSALHQRTLSLPAPLSLDMFQEEVEMVKQAVFTEPYDQSNWFYYRWLVESFPLDDERLAEETSWIEELVQEEPKAKLAWVTLAHVLEQGMKTSTSPDALQSRCKDIYTSLVDMDVDHKHFYEDRLRALAV